MKTTLATRDLTSGHRIEAGIVGTYQGILVWSTIDGKQSAQKYQVGELQDPIRKNGNTYTHHIGKVALLADEAARIIAAQEAEVARIKAEKQALLDKNVPGLELVRQAITASADEAVRYQAETEAMMNDGDNDGVNPPRARDKSLGLRADELRDQYPRASVYMRAESYSHAANSHKIAAGKRAMDLLANGADIADAERALNDWLPAEAMWR